MASNIEQHTVCQMLAQARVCSLSSGRCLFNRYSVTSDCLQAKAVLPDKVCETFNLLLKHGKTPDSYSLGALVDVYGRANQPLKAQQWFDAMTAEYGFTPTVTNWNALLGAYAKAGHKVCPCLNDWHKVPFTPCCLPW